MIRTIAGVVGLVAGVAFIYDGYTKPKPTPDERALELMRGGRELHTLVVKQCRLVCKEQGLQFGGVTLRLTGTGGDRCTCLP